MARHAKPMIARLRNAYRDVWTPQEQRSASEARLSGVLVMLVSAALSFLYIGLVWSTPLGNLASGDAFELFILPAMLGVCLSAQGGYRAVVGKGLTGTSVLASAARILVAMTSLFVALIAVGALFLAARSVRRERAGSSSPELGQEIEPTSR